MDQIVSSEANGKSNKNAQRAGSVRWRNGKADVRLSLGDLGRKTFQLPTCKTDKQANARRALLAELADRLIAAGRVEMGYPLLEKAAAREGTALDDVRRAIDAIVTGDAIKRPTGEMTIEQLADKWTSGEIARLYPDRVKTKKDRSVRSDKSIFRMYVCPIVREIPVRRFTLDHGEEVMRQLPADLEANTRRHVAQAMHRLLSLAVMPMRLLPANPLPPGFVPPPAAQKAMGYLYPDEDARLLACGDVPLADRIFYAFLEREGMRYDEAERLEWSDLDLVRGAVVLDVNKTNDPRAWALRPDTVRALRVWKTMREGQGAHVFETRWHAAEHLRDHLQIAGIDREVLFEQSATRQRLRVHDLRATFVTLGLANGRTEAWITDRTGHKSSKMVNRYRRAARTVAELGLGDLAPMDQAIPEIAAALARKAATASTHQDDAATKRAATAEPPTAATVHASEATATAEPSIAASAHVTEATARRTDAATTAPSTESAAGNEASEPAATSGAASEVVTAGPATLRASDATAHGQGAEPTRATAPARGASDDVMSGPASWSGAGPSLPEAYRAASNDPESAEKSAPRALAVREQPYSLRRGRGLGA